MLSEVNWTINNMKTPMDNADQRRFITKSDKILPLGTKYTMAGPPAKPLINVAMLMLKMKRLISPLISAPNRLVVINRMAKLESPIKNLLPSVCKMLRNILLQLLIYFTEHLINLNFAYALKIRALRCVFYSRFIW